MVCIFMYNNLALSSSMIPYRLLAAGSSNTELNNPFVQAVDPYGSPAVSAIMVTRGDLKKIENSLMMFKNQRWRNKEIVVVCECNEKSIRSMLENYEFKSLVVAVSDSNLVLGDLRNIGIAASSGEYFCQWDDDDIYHPMRISSMMAVLIQSGADAAFLEQWFLYDLRKNKLALSHKRVWEGSVIAKRCAGIIYPSKAKQEDTLMVNQLLKSRSTVLVNAPILYTYCVTGDNTWGPQHMNRLFQRAVKNFSEDEAAAVMERNPAFNLVLG